jgi:hypothetical protein
MQIDQHIAAMLAQEYFGVTWPLKRLGWGIGGFVYLSPDSLTAVKVHTTDEGFQRERDVYVRLRKLRMTQLHGLTIPRLIAVEGDIRLIQMDFVSAPFLLDFAGVRYQRPEVEFDAERIQYWHETIVERYGPNASIAYAVHHSLAQHGLYYMDFRPSNMNLTGLPGLLPPQAPDPDELLP